MLFRFFLSRFKAAISASLVLVPVFFPSKAQAQVRGATLSSAVGRVRGRRHRRAHFDNKGDLCPRRLQAERIHTNLFDERVISKPEYRLGTEGANMQSQIGRQT